MENKKNTELNFLYLNEDNEEKKKKKKPIEQNQKLADKKRKTKKKETKEQETFDFDHEIVIGVTKLPSSKETNSKSGKSTKKVQKEKLNKKTNQKIKNKKQNGAEKRSAPENKKKIELKNKKDKQIKKNNKVARGIVKWTILLTALMASFIFFMMSPLFNIVEIKVTGNQKISSDTVLSLSEIQIGENLYKKSSHTIEKKIKQNPYIWKVEVKRTLPNKIELQVYERIATYQLPYANSYAYINNQGYILEITQEKMDKPVITGYTTSEEEIKLGDRIKEEDLQRLETVHKIMDSLSANEMGNLITGIDISNKEDYKIMMESEKKTIYLGNASNLSNRMLFLKAALEDAKGLEGDIFINGDLNKQKPFFRQK